MKGDTLLQSPRHGDGTEVEPTEVGATQEPTTPITNTGKNTSPKVLDLKSQRDREPAKNFMPPELNKPIPVILRDVRVRRWELVRTLVGRGNARLRLGCAPSSGSVRYRFIKMFRLGIKIATRLLSRTERLELT